MAIQQREALLNGHAPTMSLFFSSMELCFLCRTFQSGRRGHAASDGLGNLVEVARSHLALVLGGGIATWLHREFSLLQPRIRRHAALFVAEGQLEHAVVESVETCQRHKLEDIAHFSEALLEAGDGLGFELLLPV